MSDEQFGNTPNWQDENYRERGDSTGMLMVGVIALAAVAAYVGLHRPVPVVTATAAPAAQVQAAPNSAPASGVVWESSFESAMASAKAQQKPLLVDFYTDWCPVCKDLDRQYSDTAVTAAMSNCIAVKVNAEQRTDLASSYGVKGYPTLIAMNSNGAVLNSMSGSYRSPGDFASWLRYSLPVNR